MVTIAPGITTDFQGAQALMDAPEWAEPQWNPIENKWEL